MGIYGLLWSNIPVIPDGKVQSKLLAYKVPVALIWIGFVPHVITSKPASAIGFLSIFISKSCE